MLDPKEKEFTDYINDLKSDATRSNYTRTLDQFISWTQTLDKKNQFESYSALSKTTKAKIQPLLESYIQFLSKEKNPNSVPKYLDGPKSFLNHHDIDYNNRRLRSKYPWTKTESLPLNVVSYKIKLIWSLCANTLDVNPITKINERANRATFLPMPNSVISYYFHLSETTL